MRDLIVTLIVLRESRACDVVTDVSAYSYISLP